MSVFSDLIRVHRRPEARSPYMILGFEGWMDSGQVSTGSLDYLIRTTEAQHFADIVTPESYLYNFPGSMELSAEFRPHVRINNGLIEAFEEVQNSFYYSESSDLIFFEGKEPHLGWHPFAEAILSVAQHYAVKAIYFVGSVAGMVPHTRPPYFHSTVSEARLLDQVQSQGLRPSNYEGPGSFVTYLTTLAADRSVPLITLVAETPAYVEGINPICIEASLEKIAALIDLPLPMTELHEQSLEFREHLNTLLSKRTPLGEEIRSMEARYDALNAPKEEQKEDLDDLKDWFERQDIQLD